MSDSVDRWHPSNVEWPADSEGSCPAPGSQPAVVRWSSGWNASRHEVIPADAYEALYADRGRVLAAVEKRVEGLRLVPPNVGYGDGWQDYNSAIDDALNAIKSSSSSSTEEREV